jgi:hypothetical protein
MLSRPAFSTVPESAIDNYGKPQVGGPRGDLSQVHYRVGRHLGRTVYRVVTDTTGEHDELIGMMDTPDLGAMVVEALNLATRMRERAARNWGDLASVPPESS